MSTPRAFTVPADFDLDSYRRERLYVAGGDAVTVTVVLDKIGAARVGAAWPSDRVTELAGGGAQISIDCEGLEWVVGWTLSFGAHARIASPPEAQKALLERVGAMLTEYA